MTVANVFLLRCLAMTNDSSPAPRDFSNDQIARAIDHALLHPTMTDSEIRTGCELAARLNLRSVCVKPYAIPMAAEILHGTAVEVGTVIGFPHGSSPSLVKAAEADWACRAGAVELDMVVNVGRVLQGDWDFVRTDIDAVLQVARQYGAILKVIFETDYLPSAELKRQLCRLCVELKVDFTKTSTGFGFKKMGAAYDYLGATEEDIRMMVEACRPEVQVKASGGIRNRADAVKFLSLGCTRLGTSASAAILAGQTGDSQGY
jgi:deoxyribose-phosphate aldolase